MSQQTHPAWKELLEKYWNNSITREELEVLLTMADAQINSDELTAGLREQWNRSSPDIKGQDNNWDVKFEQLLKEARTQSTAVADPPVVRLYKRRWMRLAAAAVLCIMLGAATTLILITRKNKQEPIIAKKAEAPKELEAPKDTRAMITLANGEKIFLDSADDGTLVTQGSVHVVKTADGRIVYNTNGNETDKATGYNSLFNPRGSKVVSLTLSDGTKVWLNSQSSLRYPIFFTGFERKVEITGEAYFEVATVMAADGNKMKFVVDVMPTTGGVSKARIDVLGTHFNVNAYDDEENMKTTLLEGSVRLSKDGKQGMLKPGQQAQVGHGHINIVEHVNTEAVMAWKEGYFSFNETDLVTLMRQIGRWYNVEIEYAGAVPRRKFGGEITRNAKASEVLKILEESKVYCRIEGNKIIVLP